MKTSTYKHAEIARKEIFNRLIGSLLNESDLSVMPDIKKSTNFKQIKIVEIKETQTFLIIFQGELNNQSVIEIDQSGNFKQLKFLSFLDRLFSLWEVPHDKRKRLHKEISNSYQNMKAAFEWESKNLSFILSEIDNIVNCSSFDQINRGLRASEAIPFKGHPLHPCTKTKFGLSKNDTYKYCPEFFPAVALPLVSVKKELIKEYGDDTLWTSYLKANTAVELSEDETIFPVHPWHYKKLISTSFSKALRKGAVKLHQEKIVAYPTLSLRTHALEVNGDDRTGIHIKLPIAIQATSVFRLLSERDIYNGIIFSENLLAACAELKSVTIGKGIIVRDIYGTHLIEQEQKFRQGPQLSFTFRENPSMYAFDKEKLVVASSLTHSTLNLKTALLTVFQEKSGGDVWRYLQQLFHIILYMPIEMFLKLGVALDIHGQNCLIKFNADFVPQSMVYRDLGSIQIAREFDFSNQMQSLLIEPLKTILSYEDCINEFFHSLYCNLIGNIIDFSVKQYHIEANYLWEMVKDISLDIIERTDCPGNEKIRFKSFLLNNTMPVKSLLRMRVADTTIFNKISNPLLYS